MSANLQPEQHYQISKAVAYNRLSDPKRKMWLLSPLAPIIGWAMYLGVKDQQGPDLKNTLVAWSGSLFTYGFIPALDVLIGKDDDNLTESAFKALENDAYYQKIVHAFIPLNYTALFIAAHQFTHRKMPWYNKLGVAITAGIGSGIAINAAHELGHKQDSLNRTLARFSLAPSAYGHFAIEHNFGHHRWVATPQDPATSRYNESFWQFLPRTVIGGLRSAINIERKRLERRNKGFWHKNNELLQGWAITAALYAALYMLNGKKVIPFIAIQALYGFSLLESVNYLEHYGLLRQKDANGRYEPTRPEHSWNSNNTVTNLFLYQLQRHSDHHAHPSRPYQVLRHFDESPQLPSGYASMIVPAYIPPLWFAMMNKRVVAHYKGDMSRINMHDKPLSPSMQRATEYVQKGLDWLGKFKK
ncbi:alkane 1-monooxygenase [Psychrobacter sp. FDAARGOS_221]|uniref:alkane 1-monooxygenase n=1 Tax=Psychrobacter sp. FDAARGOS_221 TaxID=1975705 RepID=UPI000BB58750|nr:alkane 1-monooxygenase [Psychrobacter sp. FDAARGOS_221]PNK61108.1 alkane 1-monooxygenase [Psychrobacter sp. FDAARGOS_221]